MGVVEDAENFARERMSNLPPSHNFSHVNRVRNIALRIAKGLDVDKEVLELAALLHDIGLEEELRTGKDHAEVSARIAREFLSGRIDNGKLDKVVDAVYCHRYSKGRRPKYLEGLIIQDADRLDALGAIGIARVFASAKSDVRDFYNPDDPFYNTDRKLDDKRYALDHFYSKLLKLQEMMNTTTGKEEARRRSQFMLDYIRELKREINQKD